jgi:hypothetical protein
MRTISEVTFDNFSYYYFILRNYSTTETLRYRYIFQVLHHICFIFRQVKINEPLSCHLFLHHMNSVTLVRKRTILTE